MPIVTGDGWKTPALAGGLYLLGGVCSLAGLIGGADSDPTSVALKACAALALLSAAGVSSYRALKLYRAKD